MNKNTYALSIFEEYCDKVEILPGNDSVEVIVQGKYFTELYTRVMLHGWACLSILSDENDNHTATFVENSALGFLEKFMDEDFMNEFPNEDENDWWKNSE
tara:strand:+ start:398 stop:697 length:300 start_codon:yes stop_codon:yes gene_type:complete